MGSCRILPNWNTKKDGKCNRLLCQYQARTKCIFGDNEVKWVKLELVK